MALLATVVLLPPRARADVAGTGTFTVQLFGLPTLPVVSVGGDITFDDASFTPLGSPVNLGSSVGQMTWDAVAQVAEEPPSATFSLTADDPNSPFAFTASGAGACDEPNCIGGTATFAGRLNTVSGTVLPDGVFTFDGTAAIAFMGTGPGGAFGINAFPAITTDTGSMVTVASGPSSFFHSRLSATRTFQAQATFTTVGTGGDTSFVGLSSVPGAPPAGIVLLDPISVFVDVATDAGFSGSVRVCIAYDDGDGDGIENVGGVAVSRLRLLHAATTTFVDVTESATGGLVCGTVDGLSPFILGVADDGSTTTTTVSGGGGTTTTTTLPLGGCLDPVACLETALGTPLCSGETIHPKLAGIIRKNLGKARTLLQKAGTAASTKVAKLIAKARKKLNTVGAKADAFAAKKKNPISPGCRDDIRAALGQIGAALEANPPTGSGGGGGTGVSATISGYPDFRGGGYYLEGPAPFYAEGCVKFSGSQECERLFTFSIDNVPLGTPQTIVQPPDVVSFITYSEYPIPSPSVSSDISYYSTEGTIIEVTGLVNGRLQGRFSGTLREVHPNSGASSVQVEGTFNVPKGSL